MIKQNFLRKLKKEDKLKLVEPSKEIKISYIQKAENCLKSAKILQSNKLYENAVSEAYYCMYNSLLALLYNVGIKSENHSASIILLKKIFKQKELYKIISFAKTERIDKQYLVESQQTIKITNKSSEELIAKSEDFLLKIKIIISRFNDDDINLIRKSFENALEQ